MLYFKINVHRVGDIAAADNIVIVREQQHVCLQLTQVSALSLKEVAFSPLCLRLSINPTDLSLLLTLHLRQQFFALCMSLSKHYALLHPLLLLPPPSQLNVTALDWSQLSKKECVKYGGSLVGKSCKYVPDLALMSFILFFGTYSMTVSLKKFKFSRYFPTKVGKLSVYIRVLLNQVTQHFCKPHN